MRMIRVAIAFPLLLAAPALAQEPKPAGDDAVGAEIVCKYQAKTGTRFTKKTCRTKAQWEALYQKSRRDAEENFNKPTIDITRTPPGTEG